MAATNKCLARSNKSRTGRKLQRSETAARRKLDPRFSLTGSDGFLLGAEPALGFVVVALLATGGLRRGHTYDHSKPHNLADEHSTSL